jgi:hypothetical protein
MLDPLMGNDIRRRRGTGRRRSPPAAALSATCRLPCPQTVGQLPVPSRHAMRGQVLDKASRDMDSSAQSGPGRVTQLGRLLGTRLVLEHGLNHFAQRDVSFQASPPAYRARRPRTGKSGSVVAAVLRGPSDAAGGVATQSPA